MEFTIVVPDNSVVKCIAGSNDQNLRLIEQKLGVPVFTKGNELSIETEDKFIQEQFSFIIDRITDEINCGGNDCDDIVRFVLNTDKIKNSYDKNSTENSIIIPGGTKRIYPRSQNQEKYINLLKTKDVVFCTGSAGSGKTFLAVAQALKMLLNHEVNKIVITRPVVEAGESLGYLPGDMDQKIEPYLRPLKDAMNYLLPFETYKRITDAALIETAPLAYMRGRTLNNCVVILDEAQNTTISQMKLFLTRMGENSKMFISGDVSQVDLPKKTVSGLIHVVKVLNNYKKFENIDEIGFMNLTADDVIRNPVVKKIVKAYENETE